MTRRACGACGETVIGPKKTPLNAAHNPRGLVHATTCAANQTRNAMTILRGPADADHYRVRVGRYGDRWYTDPLPACEIAPAVQEGADVWPSVSSIKNASSKDWTFVGLKRVAAALTDDPRCLDGLDYTDLYERLKAINKRKLRDAQDRGNNIHLYFERGLRGQSIDAYMPDEPGAEYLPAVRAFFDAYQPELMAAEVVCINRSLNGVGYGGTSDGIIRLKIEGEVRWVDWKSRGEDSSHGAYAEEAGQLGAYAGAEYMIVEGSDGPQRQRLPKSDGGLVVSVKTDGCRLYPIDLDKAAGYFADLHSWWVAKQDETKAIGRPLAPRAVVAPAPERDDLLHMIDAAPTSDALKALWATNRAVWTDAHTAAAKARTAALTAEVAA